MKQAKLIPDLSIAIAVLVAFGFTVTVDAILGRRNQDLAERFAALLADPSPARSGLGFSISPGTHHGNSPTTPFTSADVGGSPANSRASTPWRTTPVCEAGAPRTRTATPAQTGQRPLLSRTCTGTPPAVSTFAR